MERKRRPQGGVYATVTSGGLTGRVWVESWNSLNGTALVRFGKGFGSRVRKVPVSSIDFGNGSSHANGGSL